MVKRYDMDSEQWEDFIKTVPREETDGNFVYYTDHAAEMDKLRARLEVAVQFIELTANATHRTLMEAQSDAQDVLNELDKIRGME